MACIGFAKVTRRKPRLAKPVAREVTGRFSSSMDECCRVGVFWVNRAPPTTPITIYKTNQSDMLCVVVFVLVTFSLTFPQLQSEPDSLWGWEENSCRAEFYLGRRSDGINSLPTSSIKFKRCRIQERVVTVTATACGTIVRA